MTLICYSPKTCLPTVRSTSHSLPHHFPTNYNVSARYKGSNTGKRARRENLRHPRERFLVSNEAPPSWRPIEIFPAGVWDFSVLPSYRCLILFLTNFPILYVFRCLILFLTKTSLFCLHSIERFPAKLFSVGEVNCRFIDIHPCIGSFLIVFNKYIIHDTTTAINTCKHYLTLVKGR